MKKKETIRSLWTPTAGMLTGARRAAMLLLTTLLLTMAAQTAWAQDDENRQITVTVTWVDDNNLDGKRPTSVSGTLSFANEETIDFMVAGVENWTATYELPEDVDASAEIGIRIDDRPSEDLYEYSIEGTDITFTRKTGNLTVTNTVTNNLVYLNVKEFTFTVTLEPAISGAFGNMNFVDGTATFTLKNGESLTASDLPTSLDYTVTVDPEAGFTPEESTITGTIATDGPSTAEFAHTYSAVGSVTLEAKANVENLYLQAKSFFFKLLNADGEVIRNVEQNNETGKATFAPINYTLDDLEGNESKDFAYTIEQVIPEGAETINGWPANDGVAYENEPKQVIVTVTDNGDGTLGVLFDGEDDFTIPVWDNKVVATVTADDLSKDYGEDDPEFTAKVKVGEEEISEGVVYSLSRVEGENVGEYVITPEGESIQGDYTIIYNSGTLTISRKAVTITAGSDSRTYDGTALNKNTFTATPLESGDTHTFTVEMTSESTITDVGTQPNVIAKVDDVAVETGEETIVGNYLVTTVNGTLTINPITENVTVTITEHSNSDKIVYDGKEHTVTGYDVTSISNTLYTEADFTFSGNAEVKGTNTGTYEMELKPGDFTNTNQNFSNVTFNVIDGALTITPVIVKVSVVDKADGKPIVGNQVDVRNSNGIIIHEWNSTEDNHEISVLKAGGEYTIMGHAYIGYTNSAVYTLTIDENGNVSYYSGTRTQDGVLLVENPFTVPLFAANSSNLWMTWCDKYDYVKPEGVTVYTVNGVENNTVTLGEVSESVIPAYTPVLLYREAAGDDVVTATFSALGTEPQNSSSGIVEANLSNNVTLYGNSGDEAYASGDDNNIFAISDFSDTQSYVLRNGNFVAVDEDGGIVAHRCWLNVKKSAANGARMLSIDTDSESTGIETTNFTNPANSSGAWYGLDGRKLDKQPTKKGLYIYNGKKHVIK